MRCYGDLVKEIIVEVLSNLLARLGSCLVWAVVEFVAIWSLDTVNTSPLTQIARADPT